MRDLAPFLPAYHGGALARAAVGVPSPSGDGAHALWLIGFTALFLTLAAWAYRRDEGRHYR